MQRAHSRRSDNSDAEMDGLAEQELAKLQRQYRIMEGDRKAYSEESQNLIRKQRAVIDQLQSENTELMKDNRLAGSQQNQGKDTRNTDVLSDLLDNEQSIKVQIDEEKEVINSLDVKIRSMEKKISTQRKNMGGVHMSQHRHVQTQKNIKVLENRLDIAFGKFNTGLKDNAKLREDIDHMRLGRGTFEGIYKKLEKQLTDCKREMGEVIETSTAAYDARDEAQAKMMAMKEKADKDLAQYNMELKELMRIIDHDRKLKEFMRIKGEERAEMMEGELTSRRKKRDDKDKGDKAEETVESYEEAFRRIKEATEIEDIDQLVTRFIEVEDKNFALFNYVNELNNEIEMLQDQTSEVRADIEKFKSEGVDMESQRKTILKDLEDKLNVATKEAEQYDSQSKQTKKIMEQLKQGIDSLFNKINCDKTAIVEMLGGSAGVTDTNMTQYLGIIEQRTNELLQVQAFNAAKDSEREDNLVAQPIGLLGQGPQAGVGGVSIVPPSTGDDYESEGDSGSDEEMRPLTQTELKHRIMRGISKREAQPKKSMRPGSESSEKPAGKKKKGTK